jgi:hypothetical protein
MSPDQEPYASLYGTKILRLSVSVYHQRIRVLKSKIKSGNTSISQIPTNNEIRELQESVINLQCRSMKNNLIFTNPAEQPTEDVEIKLPTFIFEKLGIEHKIEIGNVHRFGKRYNDRPRPIVARFLYHKDLRIFCWLFC